MSLKEMAAEALALTERERAELVATLLDTPPDAGLEVTDAEVAARERELDGGAVEPISHSWPMPLSAHEKAAQNRRTPKRYRENESA